MTVPTLSDVEAAWHGLPPAMRDRIGIIAVDMVFQAFESGDAYEDPNDRPVSDVGIVEAAIDACNGRLTELHQVVENAMPDLFGPPGEDPTWADARQPAGEGA